MKEATKIHLLPTTKKSYSLLKTILKQVIFVLIGFVSARTKIFGNMRPFGVSFCAASLPDSAISCFLGAALGYAMGADVSSFVYIVSSAAASVIRIITIKYSPKKTGRVWAFCSAALLLFLTGAVEKGATFSSLFIVIVEALIGGTAAFFADLCFEQNKFSDYAAIFTGAILLTGFINISFVGVSVGILIAVVLVALAGEYGGVSFGAVCGLFCGLSCLFATKDLLMALILILSGAAAGISSPLGKMAIASAMTLSSICVTVGMDFPASSVKILSSLLVAVTIYLIIPRSIAAKIAVFVKPPADTDTAFGVRRNIELKLGFVADALRKINDITGEISNKLLDSDRPVFERVLAGTKREACSGCSFNECCWKLERRETERAMKEMAKSIHNRRPLGLTELSSSFEIRCPRKEKVENAIMKFYSRYQNESANDLTARHVRNALYDQFSAISELLDMTATDISRKERYNTNLAKSISRVLAGLGLGVKQCCCILDEADILRVEVVLDSAPELPISRSKIREVVGNLSGKEFGIPEINRAQKEFLITLCEKTQYEIEFASYSIKSDSAKVCGDTAQQFLDGKGKAFMVISDGMGTGTRAALDSNMTTSLCSRLIGAGFDYSPLLKLINTSMMYRSGEESLATLDIAEINLYTGELNLYKAGSAPTLICKSGHSVKAECHSLPLGILRNVSFEKATSKLTEGDIILMMSDGATTDGTDWITMELEDFSGSAQALCELIATKAKKFRRDNHSDDITVSAAILHRQI